MKWKTQLSDGLRDKATLAAVIHASIDSRGDLINKNGDFFAECLDVTTNKLIMQGTPHGVFTFLTDKPNATTVSPISRLWWANYEQQLSTIKHKHKYIESEIIEQCFVSSCHIQTHAV